MLKKNPRHFPTDVRLCQQIRCRHHDVRQLTTKIRRNIIDLVTRILMKHGQIILSSAKYFTV